jgi:hypothetical protein
MQRNFNAACQTIKVKKTFLGTFRLISVEISVTFLLLLAMSQWYPLIVKVMKSFIFFSDISFADISTHPSSKEIKGDSVRSQYL